MNKIIKIGISGALVPIILIVIVFLILVGGVDGTGKEPTKDNGSLPTIIINGIGFPYANGTYVTLTQGFWTNPADAVIWWGNEIPPYARGVHPAVDFSVGYGTPILTILAGLVIYTGYNAGFGQHVIIHSLLDDGTAVFVLYGHFSQILTQTGDRKEIGDMIGAEGDTGLSLGSHLHLEISTEYVAGAFWGNIDYRKIRTVE